MRRGTKLLIAVVFGFAVYRVALSVPLSSVGVATATVCAEGKAPRPEFDPVTGLPRGVVVGCVNRDGVAEIRWGPAEVDALLDHWARAAILGLGAAAIAIAAIRWSGRRNLTPSARPGTRV